MDERSERGVRRDQLQGLGTVITLHAVGKQLPHKSMQEAHVRKHLFVLHVILGVVKLQLSISLFDLHRVCNLVVFFLF